MGLSGPDHKKDPARILTDDEIFDLAVAEALFQKGQSGVRVGDVVAHHDRKLTMRVREIQGEHALVGYGDDLNSPTETLPLGELFDPLEARELASLLATARNAKMRRN